MNRPYPGVYRAKCSADDGTTLTVFIPQVFGETRVFITNIIGSRPSAGSFGWVAFEAGDSSYPVWMGSAVT